MCCYCISRRDPSFQALRRKDCRLQGLCLTELSVAGSNYGHLLSGRGELSSTLLGLGSPVTTALSPARRSQGGGRTSGGAGRAVRREGRHGRRLRPALGTEAARQEGDGRDGRAAAGAAVPQGRAEPEPRAGRCGASTASRVAARKAGQGRGARHEQKADGPRRTSCSFCLPTVLRERFGTSTAVPTGYARRWEGRKEAGEEKVKHREPLLKLELASGSG